MGPPCAGANRAGPGPGPRARRLSFDCAPAAHRVPRALAPASSMALAADVKPCAGFLKSLQRGACCCENPGRELPRVSAGLPLGHFDVRAAPATRAPACSLVRDGER